MIKDEIKNNYLDVLQVLRGVAALMVVCHHTIASIKFYHKIEFQFFNLLAIIGKFGVDFFFVLSGFIISYSAFYKYDAPNSFKNYIRNRLIRIYVPYLPIGVLMFLAYTFMPNLSNSERNISALTSLTLIPNGNPALSVAWSLSFELLFYILFSISFFSRKSWYYFMAIWFSVILLFNFSPLQSVNWNSNPFFRIFLSTYNIEFILGFFLALLVLKKYSVNLKFILTSLVLATVGFLFCVVNKYSIFNFSINFLFSIISFIIIYLAIVYYNVNIKKASIMMLVGNATYSIYLIHNPLQMIVVRFFPKINNLFSVALALFLVIISASLIGYLYYLVFEKAAIQRIKKLFL